MKKTKPHGDREAREVFAFSTELGWMAILGIGGKLEVLTFGHASQDAALDALAGPCLDGARFRRWNEPLIGGLLAYARGKRQTFLEVAIDWRRSTAFQRDVMEACRRIPWGEVVSYGELARRAGHPGAARAVGRCMAANRVPLVVPCHRVLGADGRLRGYSGVGGLETKRRLLALEAARVPAGTLRSPGGR